MTEQDMKLPESKKQMRTGQLVKGGYETPDSAEQIVLGDYPHYVLQLDPATGFYEYVSTQQLS